MNFTALHTEIRKKVHTLWHSPETLITDFHIHYPELDYSAFEVQAIELAALLRVLIDAKKLDITKYTLPYQRVELDTHTGMTTALARLPDDGVDGYLPFRDLISIILHHCRCDISYDFFVGDVGMRVISPERISKNVESELSRNSFLYQISFRDFLNHCSDIEKHFSSKEVIFKKIKTLSNSKAPDAIRGVTDNLQLLQQEVGLGNCEVSATANLVLQSLLSIERIDDTLVILYKSEFYESVFEEYYKKISQVSEPGTTGLRSTAQSFTERHSGTMLMMPLQDFLNI